MKDKHHAHHEPEPEKKSPISLGMIAGVLGIISAVAGMAYAYIAWHFDTFVYNDKMSQYQTQVSQYQLKMTTQLESMQQDLSDKNAVNYLEVIIILKENELRELDNKVDSGATLSAEEQRRQQSIADSISTFKEQRNKIIGLPEGLQ